MMGGQDRRALWRRTVALLAPLVLASLLAGCEMGTTTVVTIPVEDVRVSPSSVTLAVQGTQQLGATVHGRGHPLKGRTVTWSSSNTQVATVDGSGVVRGVGAGTATITAMSEGRTGGATVTVPTFGLTVTRAGTGSGTVTSSPSGINCGTACSASYASGTVVTLTAAPSFGSVFGGWSGACTGSGTTCPMTMSQARSVTATFTTSGPTLGIGFGPEQFALIPAGTFQMGDMVGNGWHDERPVHTVNLTKAFYMQKTEVTQGQWRAVMGWNPSYFSACGDTCPVEMVSWNDIQSFLAALNTQDPGKNYRLPTEAEWEYAARAGTTGDYGGTGVLDQMGWYPGNSGSRTHPVAQKQPNHWGLFDMHGNVREWVQDGYSQTYYQYCVDNGIVNDPPGPASVGFRVMRGGSWDINGIYARSAYRGDGHLYPPNSRWNYYGFRLARTQ